MSCVATLKKLYSRWVTAYRRKLKLSERFGVNRHTLRRAIEVLRQEGIVGVERGRGTFGHGHPDFGAHWQAGAV